MSSVFGSQLQVSLFGESHGEAVGVVVDGLPSGLPLDMEEIRFQMSRRAPGGSTLVTQRKERDVPRILSGVYCGYTTGTPLCAVIENQGQHTADYGETLDVPRPGHADYTGHMRYGGYGDHRGGGHFSGRLTAPLVFAGALCRQWLLRHGIEIYGHILRLHDVWDSPFDPMGGDDRAILETLAGEALAVLNPEARPQMERGILSAREQGDSLGGTVECMVRGMPAGIGSPFFGGVEQVLSGLMFAIPGVKSLSFGDPLEADPPMGSQYNDHFVMTEEGVRTATNHGGGISGGITNGMPLVFRCGLRPTPSIAKTQGSVSLKEGQEVPLSIGGRHDPSIVVRALPVVEAMAAIGLCDLWKERYGCAL